MDVNRGTGVPPPRITHLAPVKHGDTIVCATTACLCARPGTTLIRSRAQRAPRQGADAKIGRVDLDGPEKIPDAYNQCARREAHLNGALVNVHKLECGSIAEPERRAGHMYLGARRAAGIDLIAIVSGRLTVAATQSVTPVGSKDTAPLT